MNAARKLTIRELEIAVDTHEEEVIRSFFDHELPARDALLEREKEGHNTEDSEKLWLAARGATVRAEDQLRRIKKALNDALVEDAIKAFENFSWRVRERDWKILIDTVAGFENANWRKMFKRSCLDEFAMDDWGTK